MSQVVVLTNDDDETVDRVIGVIGSRHPETRLVRFDFSDLLAPSSITWEVASSLAPAQIDLRREGVLRSLSLERPFSVWYRRPTRVVIEDDSVSDQERRFISSETHEVFGGALLHPANSWWMNPPSAENRASNKLVQLMEARRANLTVPPTMVTSDPRFAKEFFERHASQGVITKPTSTASAGAFGAPYFIYTSEVERVGDLEAVRSCPTLLQMRIPKHRDVRIIWIDGEAFAAGIDPAESPAAALDFRRDYPSLKYENFELSEALRRQLADLMRRLGLVFGAIDFVLTKDGELYFLEVNPSGQFLWLEDELGLPLSDTLADSLVSHSQAAH